MESRYETEHAQLVRKLAPECTLLLKRDGRLPLGGPCPVALYGSGARRTVKGGTGSGEVNSRYSVTVEDGLRAAGFTVTTGAWLDGYDEVVQKAREAFLADIRARARKKHVPAVLEGMGAAMPQPEYELPLDGAGDVCVYVLSRVCGEGADRRIERGDLLLSETETRDILRCSARYSTFVLVLNVGGPVDLSPVLGVQNILLLSQLGADTGTILADLLLGRSCPSGKLSTTWAAAADYPAVGTFGQRDETRYAEGVFVGYRYYDAAGKAPLFPFGFGLGYTDFTLRVEDATDRSVTVTVKNVGAFRGKETVEVYIAPPQGKLSKPPLGLAAFAKTRELQPGESETLTVTYGLRDAASYDEDRAAYVLEAGTYTVLVNGESAASFTLPEDVVVRQVKNLLGKPPFEDWRPEGIAPVPPSDRVVSVDLSALATETVSYGADADVAPEIAALDDKSLLRMNIGAFTSGGIASMIGDSAQSVAGAAGETAHVGDLPVLVMADGPAGLRISRDYYTDEKGVHALGDALPETVMELLGPFQRKLLRLLLGKTGAKGEVKHQYCTAIPIGTAIAQSRNMALAEALGDMVGEEMERFHIQLWLAPALNIHRDVRCGRNFEYYSEDPLLSGKCAAAITRGVQRHPGCGTTVKHFCANNQEYNRTNNNSEVSERALREIYLRGFEICVKESQPCALMTSYNLLNGVHTAERRDLIEDVLRAEFGYEGMVMTDWVVAGIVADRGSRHRNALPPQVAASGNDVFMPGSPRDLRRLKKAYESGEVTKAQLQQNATRILRTARRLGR